MCKVSCVLLLKTLNNSQEQQFLSKSVCSSSCLGDAEQELGPPPSVDEAANTLMTRLGFLLGEKVTEVQPGPQYSMEVQDENQVQQLLRSSSVLQQ